MRFMRGNLKCLANIFRKLFSVKRPFNIFLNGLSPILLFFHAHLTLFSRYETLSLLNRK